MLSLCGLSHGPAFVIRLEDTNLDYGKAGIEHLYLVTRVDERATILKHCSPCLLIVIESQPLDYFVEAFLGITTNGRLLHCERLTDICELRRCARIVEVSNSARIITENAKKQVDNYRHANQSENHEAEFIFAPNVRFRVGSESVSAFGAELCVIFIHYSTVRTILGHLLNFLLSACEP